MDLEFRLAEADRWTAEVLEAQDDEMMVQVAGLYSHIIELNPKDPRALVGRGNINFLLSNYELALEDYEAAMRMGYDRCDVYQGIASALSHLERFDEAEGVMEYALWRWPNDPNVHYSLGISKMNLDKYGEAVAHLGESIKLGYDDASVFVDLGFLLTDLDKFEEAISVYDKALRAGSHDSLVLLGRADVLVRLDRYGEALESALMAVELDPDDPTCYIFIGEALEGLDDLEGAERNYRRALDLVRAIPQEQRGDTEYFAAIKAEDTLAAIGVSNSKFFSVEALFKGYTLEKGIDLPEARKTSFTIH